MKTILIVDKNHSANSKASFLQRTIRSLDLNKNDYLFHVDESNFINLVELKVKELLRVLEKQPASQTIMWIDAFDTYVVASDKEIEEKFLQTGADIVYSAEKNCYPNARLIDFFKNAQYLNSGCMIFKNEKFQKILELIIATSDHIKEGRDIFCDQYWHSTLFAAAQLNLNLILDTECNLFQSLYEEDLSIFSKTDGRYINTETGTRPCVFHGNGDDGFPKLNSLFKN
jgi:hypothetical protein